MRKNELNVSVKPKQMVERINEALETVFVESEFNGQTCKQAIDTPLASYSKEDNTFYLESIQGFGECSINLDNLEYIEDIGIGNFDYYINLNNGSSVHITNEI